MDKSQGPVAAGGVAAVARFREASHEANRTERSRAEPNRAEPNRAEPSRAEPSRATGGQHAGAGAAHVVAREPFRWCRCPT